MKREFKNFTKILSLLVITPPLFIQCAPINISGVKDGNIKMENPEELYSLQVNGYFILAMALENAPADDSKDWRSWIVPDGQETLKLDATESHPSWLRIDFELSSAYEGKNLAFLIPPNVNYSIYLNGEKIRSYVNYGEIVQTGSTVVQFESKFLKTGKNTLRIMGDRLIGISGPNPDILLGDPESINNKLLLRWAWTSTIVGIFVFLAFYHFVMYSKKASRLNLTYGSQLY